MAENTFHLVVASVGETRFDGPALSANLPGTAGEMTLLAHHEPIVTTLKAGTIRIKTPGSEADIAIDIESGVVECSGNRVVVLL